MKVYLDMDGVLVDFNRGVCKAFGRDDPSTNWKFWENWDGITSKNISDICNIDFWLNLNWTPEGMSIEQIVREKFDRNSRTTEATDIYLLTTPMPNSYSYTGKALWVNKHIPIYNKRLIVTPAPKSLLAGPDTLLIDDKDENIEEFRVAGGEAILCPRPWNKDSHLASQTVKIVKKYLEVF